MLRNPFRVKDKARSRWERIISAGDLSLALLAIGVGSFGILNSDEMLRYCFGYQDVIWERSGTGTLIRQSGTVRFQPRGRTFWRDLLREKQGVDSGDTIFTGQESYAELKFHGGNAIQVRPDSLLVVKTEANDLPANLGQRLHAWGRRRSDSKIELELIRGAVEVQIEPHAKPIDLVFNGKEISLPDTKKETLIELAPAQAPVVKEMEHEVSVSILPLGPGDNESIPLPAQTPEETAVNFRWTTSPAPTFTKPLTVEIRGEKPLRVEAEALAGAAEIPLPAGSYTWRILCPEDAENCNSSAWKSFTIKPPLLLEQANASVEEGALEASRRPSGREEPPAMPVEPVEPMITKEEPVITKEEESPPEAEEPVEEALPTPVLPEKIPFRVAGRFGLKLGIANSKIDAQDAQNGGNATILNPPNLAGNIYWDELWAQGWGSHLAISYVAESPSSTAAGATPALQAGSGSLLAYEAGVIRHWADGSESTLSLGLGQRLYARSDTSQEFFLDRVSSVQATISHRQDLFRYGPIQAGLGADIMAFGSGSEPGGYSTNPGWGAKGTGFVHRELSHSGLRLEGEFSYGTTKQNSSIVTQSVTSSVFLLGISWKLP